MPETPKPDTHSGPASPAHPDTYSARPLSERKAEARLEAKRVRSACWQAYGVAASEQAAQHAFQFLERDLKRQKDAGYTPIVALYYPLESEMDCRFLANRLDRAGYALALPVVAEKDAPLQFKRWAPEDPLEAGAFSVMEPEANAPICSPSTLILPLLAFNDQANRLGYGGGFYDRTLHAHPHMRAFGLAFSAQFMADMPVGELDFPLMGVITEDGVFIPHTGTRGPHEAATPA